jgi:hypothetical protein
LGVSRTSEKKQQSKFKISQGRCLFCFGGFVAFYIFLIFRAYLRSSYCSISLTTCYLNTDNAKLCPPETIVSDSMFYYAREWIYSKHYHTICIVHIKLAYEVFLFVERGDYPQQYMYVVHFGRSNSPFISHLYPVARFQHYCWAACNCITN